MMRTSFSSSWRRKEQPGKRVQRLGLQERSDSATELLRVPKASMTSPGMEHSRMFETVMERGFIALL